MRNLATIFIYILFSFQITFADELNLSAVPKSDNGSQCGCWYYYPESEGVNGDVIARGESSENGIYINLNSKIKFVGNWKETLHKNRYFTDYSSETILVSIESKEIHESQYSSSYSSLLTLKMNNNVKEIQTFRSCGC